MKPAAALIILAYLAGCGGSSASDQVRSTARQAGEALTGPHPERACKYMVDHDGCIGAIATVKALHLEVAAVANLPDDWQERLAHAKITVNGSTATLSGITKKKATYVLRDGHWLWDNR